MHLTIEQFRQDPVRVARAKEILADPDMKEMLSVLRDDGPETRPEEVGLTVTDANVRLGYIYGYDKHRRSLEILGELLPLPREQLETSYKEPDEAEE